MISLFSSVNVFASDLYDVGFLRRNSVPVEKMLDDIGIISMTPLVRQGDLIVFVRVTQDDIEVVARGSVGNIQDGKLLIETDPKSISKFPKVGDRIVSLARIKTPRPEDEPPITWPEIAHAPPAPYEPGYMQLDFGSNRGDFKSTTPNSANEFKNFNFNFSHMRFLWYFDFLWRFGMEYESSEGSIPVVGYDRESKSTSFKETVISLHYRFLPVWEELRPTLKLINKSSEFKTTNEDEYLLSSKKSSTGLGLNLHYLFNDNLFTTKKRFDYSLNRIYAEAEIFPLVSVADSMVRRGTSASGLEYGLKVGATALIYTDYIPYLKFLRRISLDASAGYSQTRMQFSGEPSDPVDVLEPIPQGASYIERQMYFKIMIGFRMDDYIGNLLKPRER